MTPPMTESAPLAVGLGESLLRLSATGHERLGQAHHLDVQVGGSEMNGLIAMTAFGFRTRWLTRIADNVLCRRIARHATEHGVEPVVDWDPTARTALYFVEHGAHPRHSEVLYDRSATAMTELTDSTFSWAREMQGAKVALSSGITCALGTGPAQAVRSFLTAAQQAEVRTVFDVNHRGFLWSWGEAVPVLRQVLPFVDILSASHHDLLRLVEGATDGERAVDLARRAIRDGGHQVVVLRENMHPAPGRTIVRATAVTAEAVVTSGEHETQVVDAFGAGDAALAAFVTTWLADGDLSAAVEASAWAGAFQQTVVGDAWQGRASDLERRDQTRRILR